MWCVDAAPAEQLRAPRHVCVLTVYEKIGVEKLIANRDILDHLAPVQRRGRSGSEHILVIQIMAVVNFLAAAVQMPQLGREINARGIDELLFRQIEARQNGEQLTTD